MGRGNGGAGLENTEENGRPQDTRLDPGRNPMTTSNPPAATPGNARRRRWRRRLKWIGIVSVVLLLLAVATGWWLLRPSKMRGYAIQALERVTGGEVEVGKVRLEGWTRVVLDDVWVRVPLGDAAAEVGASAGLWESERSRRLAHLPRASVELSVWGLVSGGLAVRRVDLNRPKFYLVEDPVAERFGFELLDRKREGGEAAEALPEVVIKEAAVVFARVGAGGVTTTRAVMLDGRLVRDVRDAKLYTLEMHEPERVAASRGASPEHVATRPGDVNPLPMSLQATIDLRARRAEASVKGFDLASVQQGVWPARVRRWLDRLDLVGRVERVNVVFEAPEGAAPRLTSATFTLDDVAINIPHPEQPGRPPYTPRMTGVSGTLRFEEGGIVTDRLSGKIEGIEYVLTGRLPLDDPEGPMDLEVVTKDFSIPESPPFLFAMPEEVVKQFERFHPSGTFRTTVRVRREAVGSPLRFTGEVQVIDAAGAYEKFPVPIRNVSGRVWFTDAAIGIDQLTGTTAMGGRVTISGTIRGHGPAATADVTITVGDVRADPSLLAYLEERERRVLEKFFDEAAYRRYVEAGLIAGAGSEAGSGAEPPYVFALGGRVNVEVQVTRRPGREEITQPVITIRPAGVGVGAGDKTGGESSPGVGVMFDEFPYPVFITGGLIIIESGLVSVRDVVAEGVSGGKGTITGEIVKREGRFRPELKLRAEAVPLDPLLVAAAPAGSREVFRNLHIGGGVDVEGRVYEAEEVEGGEGGDADEGGREDRTRFLLQLTPRDVTLSPYGGLVTFGGFTGRVTITPERVTLDKLRAERIAVGEEAYPTEDDFMSSAASDEVADVATVGGEASRSPLPPTWIDAAEPMVVGVDGTIGVRRGDGDGGGGGRAETRFDLRFSMQDMPLDVRVLSLVPPDLEVRDRLLDLAREHRPAGLWDGEVVWQTRDAADRRDGTHEENPTYQAVKLTARPRLASFDWSGERIRLSRMAGTVVAGQEVVELQGLKGAFDGGELAMTGLLTPSPERGLGGSLSITGRVTRFTPQGLAVLPEAAAAAVEAVTLRGPVRLSESRLLMRVEPVEGVEKPPATTEFDGVILFDGVSADLGVPVTGVRGRLRVGVIQPAKTPDMEEEPEPVVTLQIDATSLRASGRRIAPLSATLHSEPGQRMRLSDLTGDVYGGRLTGEGMIRYDQTPAYALRLTLSDAAFEPVLEASTDVNGEIDPDQIIGLSPDLPPDHPAPPPLHTEPPPLPERDPAAGLVSARLLLEGRTGDADSRRGRGAVEVRSASLFDQPVAMALLQAANLSLPTARSFHRGSIRFAITGQTLRFNKLDLSAGSVQIVGGGRYDWENDQLHLTMLTRNPGFDRLGPIGDILDSIKDELVTIEITGHLDDPQTRVVTFDTVRRAIDNILGRRP